LHLIKKIKNKKPIIYNKTDVVSVLNGVEELKVEKPVLDNIKTFLDTYEEVSIYENIKYFILIQTIIFYHFYIN
jgi:hypothetical protein